MATQKQINFFEVLTKQGRKSSVNSIDNKQVPEAWKIIKDMLGQDGNGEAYQNDDVNQNIVDSVTEAENNNFGSKSTRTDNLNEEDSNAGFDTEWLTDSAEERGANTPFTTEHKEAMWIAPSGRLIDGDFQDGYRNLDHRNALTDDSSEGITNATKQGAVRVMNEYDTIQTSDGTLDGLKGEAKKQAEYYINELGYELEEVDA